MQTRNRTRTAEGLLALMVLAVAPGASAMAMHSVPETLIQDATRPDAGQPDQPDSSQEKEKPVVVKGMIVKQGKALVLKDEKGVVYRLDAQDKAEPYVNQSVKVTGRLQPADESQVALLHVEQIEPEAA